LHESLFLVRPSNGLETGLSFFFQPESRFGPLRGAFLFQRIADGTIRRKQGDRDDGDADERSQTADEDLKSVDRARRVGRHISW
jgi:hypothetical protein